MHYPVPVGKLLDTRSGGKGGSDSVGDQGFPRSGNSSFLNQKEGMHVRQHIKDFRLPAITRILDVKEKASRAETGGREKDSAIDHQSFV